MLRTTVFYTDWVNGIIVSRNLKISGVCKNGTIANFKKTITTTNSQQQQLNCVACLREKNTFKTTKKLAATLLYSHATKQSILIEI